MPNLIEILNKAFDYTKNHRFLWFFGFFLTGWGTLNFVRAVDFNADKLHGRWDHIVSLSYSRPWAMLLVVLGAGLILYGMSALATIARNAIIYSALHLERKEIVTFGGVLKNTRKSFWRVFLVGLIVDISMLFVLSWFAVPLWFVFREADQGRGIVVTMIALMIFIPIIVSVSLVNIFSACFIVVYDMKIAPAIKSAFDLYALFWEQSLQLFVILSLVYFFLFFFSASLLGLVAALAYGLGILLKSLSLPYISAILFLFISVLSFILLLINAVLNVFNNFAWTLFYLKIVKAKELPKGEVAEELVI